MASPIQDLLNMSKLYAPFLHTKLVYLDREMQDIFWNPVVEWALSTLYNITRDSLAWNITREATPDFSQDDVAGVLLYLEHREEQCQDFLRGKPVYIYTELKEALRAIHGGEIQNPFDELPDLWKNQKTRRFLAVITDIIEEIRRHENKNAKEKNTTDELQENAIGSYPPPIGQA